MENGDVITPDLEDNLAYASVKDSRFRLYKCLLYVPWYSLFMALFLISMFYGVKEFDGLALDSSYPKQVYRWLTYSWFHWSQMHLWINIATWMIYSGIVEIENGWWRTLVLSQIAVVGGAFGPFWQCRFTGDCDFEIVGISGSIYGMLASQIGYSIIFWKQMSWAKRIIHIALVVSATVSDVVVTVLMYDPRISYADHVGGFVVNAFISSLVLDRSNRLVTIILGIIGIVILGAGCINTLI